MDVKDYYEEGISKLNGKDYSGAEKILKEGLKIALNLNNEEWALKFLIELGKVNYFQYKFADALENYNKSLELALKLDNKDYQIRNMYNMALVHRQLSNFGLSVRFLKDALKIAQEIEDFQKYNKIKTTYDEMFLKDSKILYDSELSGNDALAKGEIKTAIDNYEKAIQAAKRIGEYEALHRILIKLSDIYIKKLGDKKQGLAYLEEDLQILTEHFDDKLTIANTILLISQLKLQLGILESVIEQIKKAFDIFKEINEVKGQMIALNLEASVYYTQGKLEQALKCLDHAEALIPFVEDQNVKLQLYLIKGQILIGLKKFENALTSFDNALSISDEIMDVRILGRIYLNMGKLFRLWKKFEQAHQYYSRAIGIFDKLKDFSNLALSYYGTALTFQLQNDFQNAIKFFEDALNICSKINNLELSINVYKELENIYSIKKDYKKLSEILEKLAAIQNELGLFNDAKLTYNKIELIKKKDI